MAQDNIKKEALFNEVKGSLFEYLVAGRLSVLSNIELAFIKSLDANYLAVLAQQDRMVRQFYPTMLDFLLEVSHETSEVIWNYFNKEIQTIRLLGKFSQEADLLILNTQGQHPISLKLTKQNAFVNTKSGGVKSFFKNYFSFLDSGIQDSFNSFIDNEFYRMASELHSHNDMEFNSNFSEWVKAGKSELPGELSHDERQILKSYYARVASKLHDILSLALAQDSNSFKNAIPALMGFSSPDIVQVICSHDFKTTNTSSVEVHSAQELLPMLQGLRIMDFAHISSVEIAVGPWDLQIRIKPMNKFTTTAIKVNCSVRFRR